LSLKKEIHKKQRKSIYKKYLNWCPKSVYETSTRQYSSTKENENPRTNNFLFAALDNDRFKKTSKQDNKREKDFRTKGGCRFKI